MAFHIPAYPASKLAEVLRHVEDVVNRGVSRIGNPEKTGGYFCLVEPGPDSIVMICVVRIGDPLEANMHHKSFCQEKAWRLAEHPDHQSSWMSRSVENEKYGGAIRAGKHILSFSGLPELEDERAMLLAALRLGLLTPREAAAIAHISKNYGFFEEQAIVRA